MTRKPQSELPRELPPSKWWNDEELEQEMLATLRRLTAPPLYKVRMRIRPFNGVAMTEIEVSTTTKKNGQIIAANALEPTKAASQSSYTKQRLKVLVRRLTEEVVQAEREGMSHVAKFRSWS